MSRCPEERRPSGVGSPPSFPSAMNNFELPYDRFVMDGDDTCESRPSDCVVVGEDVAGMKEYLNSDIDEWLQTPMSGDTEEVSRIGTH